MSLNILEDFYNNNFDRIRLVNNGLAHPQNEDLKRFYIHVYQRNWKTNPELASVLIQFLRDNQITINRSLGQIGVSRESSDSTEYKLRNSKPFFQTINQISDDSELSYELDAVYPVKDMKEVRAEFKRAQSNKNPKWEDSRERLFKKGYGTAIVTRDIDPKRLELIPSTARNANKAVLLGVDNYKYWDKFKPISKQHNLYDPKQGKKFYGPPGTWMFDILYFSNYGSKKTKDKKLEYQQAIYLIGININTRYAVGRRIEGKSVKDLIPAFEDMLQNELDDNINLLIFDGEKAISSTLFEEFCQEHNINVRITYPGIHTQTAPIDRLCRTLRDYYTKMFMSKLKRGTEHDIGITMDFYLKKNPWKYNQKLKDQMLTESIYTRQIFDGNHRQLLAPIPIQYYKTDKGEYWKLTPKTVLKNSYEKGDELYDVIEYYNNKQHHGLTKILKHASTIFGIVLQIRDEDITPKNVHNSKGLELLIIKYCQFYNKNIEPSHQFNIGDKVEVYDCFSTDRGSLRRDNNEILMGDWEIVSKDNEIYGVVNNVNNQLLHVSKYMLRSLNATSN